MVVERVTFWRLARHPLRHRLGGTADTDKTSILRHPALAEIIRTLRPAGHDDTNDAFAVAFLMDDVKQSQHIRADVVLDAVG
jgi:hypothetical protein